jgi:hypothetical protein
MTFDFLQLDSRSDAKEIFEYGRKIFAQEFLNQSDTRGEITAHDGSKVVFYSDRYDHAFCTSCDRARRHHDKSKVAIDRIERVRWIKELICKTRSKVICKEQTPPPRWKRAYYCNESNYVVWLEPLKLQDGRPIGWKFSSAYPQPVTDHRRTTLGFKTVP